MLEPRSIAESDMFKQAAQTAMQQPDGAEMKGDARADAGQETTRASTDPHLVTTLDGMRP